MKKYGIFWTSLMVFALSIGWANAGKVYETNDMYFTGKVVVSNAPTGAGTYSFDPTRLPVYSSNNIAFTNGLKQNYQPNIVTTNWIESGANTNMEYACWIGIKTTQSTTWTSTIPLKFASNFAITNSGLDYTWIGLRQPIGTNAVSVFTLNR
jgi:hypothetical protein